LLRKKSSSDGFFVCTGIAFVQLPSLSGNLLGVKPALAIPRAGE